MFGFSLVNASAGWCTWGAVQFKYRTAFYCRKRDGALMTEFTNGRAHIYKTNFHVSEKDKSKIVIVRIDNPRERIFISSKSVKQHIKDGNLVYNGKVSNIDCYIWKPSKAHLKRIAKGK